MLATAGSLDAPNRAALGGVRLLLSAGAPVPTALLRRPDAMEIERSQQGHADQHGGVEGPGGSEGSSHAKGAA